ncbi:GL17371, partial [Drosophila persimilis]
RSKKSMRRVTITDIVSPRPSTDEAQPLRISDEDIDKIFNSYCGPYEEIKKEDLQENEPNPDPPTATPIVESRALPPAPAGTAQFYITWKELSPNQKYQYLKSIDIQNLCKILGAGFDSDTFNDLLCTIQDFYVPEKEPTTASVLLEISKNDEFPILAMLMSAEEKKMVSSILKQLKNWPKKNPQVLEKLSRAYGVD